MNLLLTAAWNPRIAQTPAALEERRRRLVTSLRFYCEGERFKTVTLLDSTIDGCAAQQIRSIAPRKIEIPALSTNPSGAFAGPSYLESLLYIAAAKILASRDEKEHFFKISGGYVVRNIDELIAQYRRQRFDALGFLHQNPLRLAPRYAMTSCMALSAPRWKGFIEHLELRLDELRDRPLESVYRQYLMDTGATRGARVAYPRLDARFTTGNATSKSLPYRLREIAWRMYARTGFFVLSSRLPGVAQ